MDFYTNETFIESPLYDNWFKKHYPQKSLIICSPYIKQDALEKIISLYDLDKRNQDFELKVLIRGNEEEFTFHKSSDISIFDTLIPISGLNLSNIRRVRNLHMKAYLIDGRHLLITSGNLTNSGIFVISGKENFEGGISSNDARVSMRFLAYFRRIWNQSEELEQFYDSLMAAYANYIEVDYSDKATLQRLDRKKYKFRSKTQFDDIDKETAEHRQWEEDYNAGEPNDISLSDLLRPEEDDGTEEACSSISLADIPPVGSLEHVPYVLNIANSSENGVTYLELGKRLRAVFSTSGSTQDGANRKFGEEKGKFAAFLNLATIEGTTQGNLVKITTLGKTYLAMSEENRNKLIKDIFFSKPIIVSIMRQCLETDDFNLFEFLQKNCDGASKTTLSRKVGPLQELFRHISKICTEDELKKITQL